ncbi:GNAT family N-acetyltransferase [Amycolatopsis dongchuanensis]|uniref:GNAT family N-acetyltransferase n=1 Tax=Amycolatopsis dongchuanensis TaxID=1070866 RepID=A0ABP8VF58_9PSEU
MDEIWRPLTAGDAEPVAGLLRAAEAVEPTHEHHSVEDVREELTAPNVRLRDGSTSVWSGERLLGYAMAVPRVEANPEHRMRVELQLHPDHRESGLGERLVGWLLRTGPQLHAQTFPDADLELHGRAHENQRWYARLLEANGFARLRSFATMRMDLGEQPVPRPLPGELRLAGYAPEHDEAIRDALNDTFAGHWGMTAYSPELFRHRVTGSPAFRPETSFLLLGEHGEVAAFVLSAFYESDAAATGVRELLVSYVGTRGELRGRGIATALLTHTVTVAREQGYERATLGVDESNAHNALGVYQRVGFEVTDRAYAYVRPVP